MGINMSNYFKHFPKVDYRFGNNESTVEFQDIGAYIDIVDQVKEYSIFYEAYNIQNGQRPDQVSIELYDSPNYYWTFFLLNDTLRTGDWPITDADVYSKTKEYYPHTAFTTPGTSVQKQPIDNNNGRFWFPTGEVIQLASDIHFKVGSWVYFSNSKAVGKILKIDQEIGLVTTNAVGINVRDQVVESIDEFSALKILGLGEFTADGPKPEFDPIYKRAEMTVHKVYDQWDSPHHYENPVTKEWIYPKIDQRPPWSIDQNSVTTRQSVSYVQRVVETNDSQKVISVIKKDNIVNIVNEFNKLIKEKR